MKSMDTGKSRRAHRVSPSSCGSLRAHPRRPARCCRRWSSSRASDFSLRCADADAVVSAAAVAAATAGVDCCSLLHSE